VSEPRSESQPLTFGDILNQQKTWVDYSDFCDQIPQIISKDVEENARNEAKLIEDLKKDPVFKSATVKDVAPKLKEAERLLTQGNVVGVDGTKAEYHLLSGVRCQIGIVAVNYQGDQIKHSFFISRASLKEEAENVLERISQRTESDDNLSNMHLRGLMLYREREAGMDPKFDGRYIMYHGPLLPFELMSGLGRLRALDITLDLLRKVVRSKKVMSVISTTSFKDLSYFGLAIEKGEYLTHPNFNMEYHLVNTSDFLTWANKWREEEREKVTDFIRDYASQIQIGVIRIGDRPYVFNAHKDIFDIAAAIIAKDSSFQAEKGFPLLIDYADNLCTEYFSSSQFNRMMDWELAKTNSYTREAAERRMRVK
jgi:hypothetical protein